MLYVFPNEYRDFISGHSIFIYTSFQNLLLTLAYIHDRLIQGIFSVTQIVSDFMSAPRKFTALFPPMLKRTSHIGMLCSYGLEKTPDRLLLISLL